MSASPCELLAQISAGPDGAAYRARRVGEADFVEVRTLAAARQDPLRWSHLTRRLSVARLLIHPGARRILDLDLDNAPPRLVLEDAGTPLSMRLTGRLPLPLPDALAVALNLAGVLRAAHRIGLGHGRLDLAALAEHETRMRIDFTGTAVREEDSPGPPIGMQAMADDVAGLAGLLVYLLTGQWVRPGDALPESLPPSIHADLADALHGEASERPGVGELEDRLRRTVHDLHARTRLDATIVLVAPSAGPAAPARGQLGRFRLLEKLGQGGMGEVYRAEDASNGAVVAVKTLLPELSQRADAVGRFHKEARLLAEVNNPFVANLLEVNEDDGVHYLAVEFVAGRSLAALLENGKPLEESFALAVIADVCRALIDAHARGIIHRDVKPENILLLADPDAASLGQTLGGAPGRQYAKLSDFGLARHVVESESLHLTRTGAVVGTPLYLSPEQCTGAAVDARSDVYGLGATLFHLLAGRPPFLGDTPLALIHHHCNTPPPALRALAPAVSEGAGRIVEKALAKSPAHRHADAGELLRDIERVMRGEPASAAAHPLRPAVDPSRVATYEFRWELAASPEELWPYVSNTERLNRAINLPAVDFTTRVDEKGRVRRQGLIRKLGVESVWEEHPFEWVEPRRFGVLRQCHSGPFKWLLSTVETVPRPGGGSTLTHRLSVEPAGLLGRAFAAVELGVKTRRALDRVYRRIDAAVAGQRRAGAMADPFEGPNRLGKTQQRRLDEAVDRLMARGLDPTVVERLGAFVEAAPPQEAARMRPIALARRLDVDPDALLAVCLHGAREGLLVLLWDLLCPLCRIPSEIKDTLKALRDHGRCEACNTDYELDFTSAVEMIFRVHPSIREAELGTYCVGGPAHSPHVVAQVRVAAHERVELDLALAEGAYRLRGPQLPGSLDLRVDPGATTARWEVELDRMTGWVGAPMRLRPGGQVLAVVNPHDQELVVRLERTAARDDAVTAARAASLQLFRELFPAEVLSPGRLIGLASVTLLATALDAVRTLPEAEAFACLHEHLTQLAGLARRHGGALVKAVGDGALAAFHEPAAAVRTALESADAGAAVRLALHRGPARAATINDHLDYFGATVRQAAALLERTGPGERLLSQAVMDDPRVSALLHERGLETEVVSGDVAGGALHRL